MERRFREPSVEQLSYKATVTSFQPRLPLRPAPPVERRVVHGHVSDVVAVQQPALGFLEPEAVASVRTGPELPLKEESEEFEDCWKKF